MLGFVLLIGTFNRLSKDQKIAHAHTQSIKLLTQSSHLLMTKIGAERIHLLKNQSFCGSYEESPTRITLKDNGEIVVHITPRPDLKFENIKVFYRGTYKIQKGSLVAHLEDPEKRSRSRQLIMPIQHLHEDGSIKSFNLENEMTERACL